MSYTELKIIPVSRPRFYKEFRNSWGWAARVWTSLQDRYLPGEKPWITGGGKSVWGLWEGERLKDEYRIVLLSTFDHAVIEWDRLKDAAAALRVFVADFPADGRVCHLSEIADCFEEIAAGRKNAGVCFYGMSCGDDPWRDYSLATGSKHFYVFESLKVEKARCGESA